MAGVSVQAFRRQGRRFGAGLVCSEMVSACGLSYGNERTLGYLRIARDEHPLAVQVFGSDPATVAEAARMCEAAGADIIDINFGCPVRKVTKTGAGASALDNHEIAVAITRAVADAVSVPVTVKLRRGVRNGARDCLVLGPKLADGRARRRSRCTRAPPSRCTRAAPITRSRPSSSSSSTSRSWPRATSPTRAGAQAVLEQTGASAVMIARGAQGDPWLLAELVDGIRREPSDAELVGELVRFVREVAREMTPERAVGWLRKFYGWYLRGGRLGPGMRAGARPGEDDRRGRAPAARGLPRGASRWSTQSERDIAALGAIEDDELLDLPISIYSAG